MRYLYTLFILLIVSSTYGQENPNSLSLEEAVKIGLKNNPLIKAAEENISASKARHLSGTSLPQPEIGFDDQWIPSTSKAGITGEKTLSISQSFEFPTVYFLKGDKFTKAEKIAFYKLNSVQRSVISQIKLSYYKILVKQYLIKSAEENLKISEDFYKKAEIRLNVGEGTNLEKLTAKVQFSEARIKLDAIKIELSSAFAELNNSIGINNQQNNSTLNLSDSLTFIDYKIDTQQLNKIIDETNPDIKIAELNSEISTIEKSIAWQSLFPNFDLAYFSQSREGSNFNGFSAKFSIPLWFMFDQTGKVNEAKANQAISNAELQSLRNELTMKLQTTVNNYENNIKQVKLYIDEIIPQAEEIFTTASKSYDAGEITYLEYLQAKQTLVSSRFNYVNVLSDHFQSLFAIEDIIGQNIIIN